MPHFPSRRRFAQVALPIMICAAVAAGAARARSNDPEAMPMAIEAADQQPVTTQAAPADGGGGSDAHHGWAMHGMEHREAWAAKRRLKLADRLATMHVYLDITPQQEDAWHGFSQALLAMVPDPKDMHADMQGEHHPMGAFDGIDRMAKMMQRRADAAKALDDAAQKLKATMTPAQIEKADAAWAAMREHWQHARWHHWHHHHHDDDHDR